MKYSAWILIVLILFAVSFNNAKAQPTSGQCNQTLSQPNSSPPQFQWTCATNGITFGGSVDNVARDDCLNSCPLNTTNPTGPTINQPPTGPVISQPGGSTGSSITNPIQSTTFGALMAKIAEAAAKIGLPLVAVFMIYAGFLFVSARGNEEQLERAKSTFFWTIIGALLVLGAFAIATAIQNFATQL